MDKPWGVKEVRAHLVKVRKHYNVRPNLQLTMAELVALLEGYDEVHPITQEQTNAVSTYILGAVDLKLAKEGNQ